MSEDTSANILGNINIGYYELSVHDQPQIDCVSVLTMSRPPPV